MRILFVSGELIGASLCLRLKEEGNDVKLFIKDRKRRECLEGFVEKTLDWKQELSWVGKDGLIVFDDVGFGVEQDRLRRKGYRVVGGSALGDKLEKDREYGQKIFSSCGIPSNTSVLFDSPMDAFHFVKENPGKWVVKQNEHNSALSYVGVCEDGKDVLSMLETYHLSGVRRISLQKKADGVEIAVGRFFNGNDWVGPICVNMEHKRLCNGDIGPLTGEMGTLMWFDDNEQNPLFMRTLSLLKEYLVRADFRGYADINCLVSESTIVPIEATMRFGCPTVQLQTELLTSRWTDLLSALADRMDYDPSFKKEFGIVMTIAAPPFPYRSINGQHSSHGMGVFFSKALTNEERSRVHLEEISLRKRQGNGMEHYIAGPFGYALYVTGSGRSVRDARMQALNTVGKITIPKMFYRTDIGMRFEEKEEKLLRQWGWIS